jgi:hypothetical protein
VVDTQKTAHIGLDTALRNSRYDVTLLDVTLLDVTLLDVTLLD